MTSVGVGAIGGIAAVFAKTFSKDVPTSGIQLVASLLTNALFSGLAGSLLGARVGSEIERSAPQAYSCNKCNHRFQPMKYPNSFLTGELPMAHLVEQMAYVGDTPWHGLGNKLSPKQSLEVWRREAGMNWDILESPVHFKSNMAGHLGSIHTFPEQKVLYRSDTKMPLSVVSQRYQTVQPKDVIEFYRDLTEVSGYELETAGVLKGGRKFWALARTGLDFKLKGKDQVNNYILLATSCDGTLATTLFY